MNALHLRALRSSLFGVVLMAACLFLPAGTLDWWQGWLFIAVFMGSSAAITVYLAKRDPALLERRMRVGPRAEKETAQKIFSFFAFVGFIGLMALPALDHRYGWSSMPGWVAVLGNLLVTLGFYFTFLVLRANSYAASTVQVVEGQKVISTGPYAVIRHPMYAGVIPLLVGMSLALGSWWGLIFLMVFVPMLMGRLLAEERLLTRDLPGYVEYKLKVRWRLFPFVW